MSLIRLIYTSRALAGFDMEGMLAHSRPRNQEAGITGGLALLEGCILQYLEGPQAVVDALFKRILRDPRHTEVQLLERREIARRLLGPWRMAVLEWTTETKQIFHSFSPGAPLDLRRTDPSTAAPLFRAWAATALWQERAH